MDKLYKAPFLAQLKARMPLERPDFLPHKLPPVGHPLRSRFTGSLLYLKQLSSGRCVWLERFPGDMRIYSIHEPSPGFEAGVLNVQAVEGRQAVAGFEIDTPWRQLHVLGPRVPDEERNRVMQKAYVEYLAVTADERVAAVRAAMDEAFACIGKVLQRFTDALEGLP